jgi:guanylate kinase
MQQAAPLLLLISAPSGAGKTTVCQHLLTENPGLSRVVTCTTRPPRPGERDGVDYHFLDDTAFDREVQAARFLEHASVYGRSYGTRKSEVLERLNRGQDVLLTVDVQGVAAIQAQASRDALLKRALVTLFLTPPTLQVLEDRLRNRGTDSEEVCRQRLSVARHEIAQWHRFDYLILSTTILEDVRRAQCIYEAEKLRSMRVPSPWLEASTAAESLDCHETTTEASPPSTGH